MDLYNEVSYKTSRLVTLDYSTSFGTSTKLFPKAIQPHIYAIYGLVRVADEIVDTYRGKDSSQVLRELEEEVYRALGRGYSANPIVQAFVLTARKFGIGKLLIEPFFESMLMDLKPVVYTKELYEKYIYGSAEVIGLMCLRVFVNGDNLAYDKLQSGAKSLGAAYQKVNFLRDMAADYNDLGRIYFPNIAFESFDEDDKLSIVFDIDKDIEKARISLAKLPKDSRSAVELSLAYYGSLLKKLRRTPVEVIKKNRIRVGGIKKAIFFIKVATRGTLNNVK